uniref:Tn3 family transposase n=1 Tax=Escherichia coli TaxID=562 RepID=A0A6F8QK44_ECOLX|nr:Tn3 family transposase [Escherichia coli]
MPLPEPSVTVKKGEIRKRYTDGQEDQLGALGLVTNAVVLWNTIYMQAAHGIISGRRVKH